MKKYTNIFSQQLSFSLKGEGAGDYIIPPGESVELPSENGFVQGLVGQGYLKEETNEVKPSKEKK